MKSGSSDFSRNGAKAQRKTRTDHSLCFRCAFAPLREKFLLLFLREGADVIHHVPALGCFGHPFLTRRHDSTDTFRDLPEDFAIRHRRHAFFVCEIRGLAAQFS